MAAMRPPARNARAAVAALFSARARRLAALAFLGLCLAGEGCGTLRQSPDSAAAATAAAAPATAASRPDAPVVQLRFAPLPRALRYVAYHSWFAAWDPAEGRWRRWEVWQDKNAGGTSWDHVHRDLYGIDRGVGGGPFRLAREWRGAAAQRLRAVLERAETYPERHRYIAWPGPNCNTFVAWVLRESGAAADLPPQAIGKDWLGWAGAAVSTTRTGLQFETPIIGLKAGLAEGIEIHPLALTLGFDLWPPAIKTPFGRLGFSE
ncbi:MAG: DUF3750 domain-containing protein [Planctomycetes bacterium]|nr:DUF3750 domain-containing protein [Planctomycetota bacterium]